MENNPVSRRSLLTILGGAAAAACVPFEKTSPFWGTISAGLRGGAANEIDAGYVRQLPYASMLAWFDSGPLALVVLGEATDGGRLNWYSKQKQLISTFGPFVAAAIGFDIDLRGTSFSAGWEHDPRALAGRTLRRTLDIEAKGERIQVALASTFHVKQLERIKILDVERDLRRVVERVSHEDRVRFENQYWIEEATGRCWKSRQVAMPTLPPLNLEVTKFPAP